MIQLYDSDCMSDENTRLKDELRQCEYCTESYEAHNECRTRVAQESRDRMSDCQIL